MNGRSFSPYMKALKNVKPQYTLLLLQFLLLQYWGMSLSVEERKQSFLPCFLPSKLLWVYKEENPTALDISFTILSFFCPQNSIFVWRVVKGGNIVFERQISVQLIATPKDGKTEILPFPGELQRMLGWSPLCKLKEAWISDFAWKSTEDTQSAAADMTLLQ